jgi:hypothetical protein
VLDDRRDTHPYFDSIAVLIYSSSDNRIEIAGPARVRVLAPKAGTFTAVYLNNPNDRSEPMLVNTPGVKSNTVFRIDAEQPIVVYCYMSTKFGGEGWTPLPVEAWGKEYVVSCDRGQVVYDLVKTPVDDPDLRNYLLKSKAAPSEVLITSAFDDTRISIAPTDRLFGEPPTEIVLQANQCYMVQSYVDTNRTLPWATYQPDISGTRITSNKPIGVIAGNSRTQLSSILDTMRTFVFFLENLSMESFAPIEQHGKEFVFIPSADTIRKRGYYLSDKYYESVRIANTSQQENGATYVVSDGTSGSFTAEAGKTAMIMPKQAYAVYIRTDHAAQGVWSSAPMSSDLGNTANYPGRRGIGSTVASITPREEWSSFVPYYAPINPDSTRHYINVATDTASAKHIRREDGTLFRFSRGNIPGTDIVWGSDTIKPGTAHYLLGDSGATFCAYQYGDRKGYAIFVQIVSPSDPTELRKRIVELYDERMAFSYSYPLAPSRRALLPGDSLHISSDSGCGAVPTIATALNPKPLFGLGVKVAPEVVCAVVDVAPATAFRSGFCSPVTFIRRHAPTPKP